jgi:hypothetical protein
VLKVHPQKIPKSKSNKKHVIMQKTKINRSPFSVNDSNIYKYSQLVDFSTLTSSLSGSSTLQLSVTLANLPNTSTFQSLYDQYRISRLTYYAIPQQTQINQTTAAYSGQYCFSVIDFDDSTALPSQAAALEYQSCLIHMSTERHSRTCVPRYAGTASSGSSAVVNASNITGWLDCAATSIPHYGFKFFCPTSGTIVFSYEMFVSVDIEFRRVR